MNCSGGSLPAFVSVNKPMGTKPNYRKNKTGLLRHGPILVLALLLSGCNSLGYYAHVVNGHLDLMSREEPIQDLLEDKDLDAKLQRKLQLVQRLRRFASDELLLPDNGSYKTFVRLERQYPVWNVIAAERYSVKAKQWCFLFTGCISYRGYFDQEQAVAMAAELKQQGYDVYVAGVAAYSTIGWFDDPVLSSMLYDDEARLAGILFHELAHQKLYIENDSSFNEAFATAVELEGVRRWLKQHGNQQEIQAYRRHKQRQKQFQHLLRQTHEALKQAYEGETEQHRLKELKRQHFQQLQQQYAELKKRWSGYSGYDKWMQQELNNAHLALVATYHELVPAFEHILEEQGHDLAHFYREVARLGALDAEKRGQRLAQLR